MPETELQVRNRATLRRMSLSSWENEGGAWCGRLNAVTTTDQVKSDIPPLADAELVQLQIRVIALENLVIALLIDASDRQLDLIREMAAYILPRPGFTPHRLTIHAAAQMDSLVERADHVKCQLPSS